MKMVLLSVSIGILGYFALQAIPRQHDTSQLAAISHSETAPAPSRDARANTIYRH